MKRITISWLILCGPLLIALLAALLTPLHTYAADSEPRAFVKSHLLDSNGNQTEGLETYQSEPVRLAIDIHSPTWFTKAPDVGSFSVAGALLIRHEKFATNFTHRVDGHSYTVQRWEYTLYPQRPGRIVVPSTDIKVTIAKPGTPETPSHLLRSNPLTFDVHTLPANPNRSGKRVVSTPQLDISQEYQQADRQLHPGDAVQRQVTVRAESTMGMLIPPLQWPPLSGTRQQSEPSRINDHYNRGEMTGIRIETRSYTFTTPGDHTLPELEFHWWDSEHEQWRSQTLPGSTISVVAKGHTPREAGALLAQWKHTLSQSWERVDHTARLLLLATLTLSVLVVTGRRRALAAWQRYRNSEQGRFIALRYSIARHDASSILHRYDRWRQIAAIQDSHDCRQITAPELDAQLAELYRMRHTGRPPARLREQLQKALKDQRAQRANSPVPRRQLNPWSNRHHS